MKLRIEIVTPAPPGTLHGNRITALRWHRFLSHLNYQSIVTEKWSKKPCDVLIALHGLRSHDSIQGFKKAYPNHPVVLIMTGTDIYRDLKNSTKVIKSMEMADAIVVLQPDAIQSLPKKFHHKIQVIYQSVKGITKKSPPKRHFLASIIGHLRSEKDPFCAAQCLPLLPSNSKVQLVQLGKAMSPEFKKQAISIEKNVMRYRWLDQLSHSKTLQWLSRSHVMIISSIMEGGAHVVSEAIAIGIPVIASDIPGNRGLLGDTYPAYYPAGDKVALSKLLNKAEANPVFYQKLCRAIALRQKITKPELEQKSIQKLIKSLIK
ncbi:MULTISPECIES: selenoneine biosynthesis selenosugar synthase SenB [Polynucleobacter]|uniref:selenoneine biosynthesis selenosugar synthase SenB n=1 Tax=Polynucleobacter TaxID=44013 RepID=UPI000A5D0AFB|nr:MULTISPECIES: selenoneine biosynthesis selenosugar synthase SenB [Polynucleobacter]MBU3553681.1 TIGR04348 family glycosyltransferase [Polynucleobacter sp. MWH-Post4-6-1]MBU3581636.1 TIGR04348 family glycosyltransferase [Polynucleobacter sp. AP-Capit-er-40B-B4]